MTLKAEKLHLRLGQATILNDISLDICPGEIVGIIGPNGAGKTSLLQLLAGVRTPSVGAVTLDGHDLAALDRTHKARQIAYLPHAGALAWPISVYDLVALGRLPYQNFAAPLSSTDHDAIETVLETTSLLAFAKRPADSLSAGELARALLARALAGTPRYLFADEPGAALDPRHYLALMTLFRRLAEQDVAIVLVLHDLSLALRFCHRLALLNEGRLIALGPPASVVAPDHLKATFSIDAIYGESAGEPYLVPWQITD